MSGVYSGLNIAERLFFSLVLEESIYYCHVDICFVFFVGLMLLFWGLRSGRKILPCGYLLCSFAGLMLVFWSLGSRRKPRGDGLLNRRFSVS